MASWLEASPLVVPGLLVLVSLAVFIVILALKKKDTRLQRELKNLGGVADDDHKGTVLVKTDVGLVRRSTRIRKAPAGYDADAPATPLKTPNKKIDMPAESATPVPKTASKTPAPAITPKTGRATRASATVTAAPEAEETAAMRPKRTPRA